MSLARTGIRGAFFISAALGFRQIVSLCVTFFIARQLQPADYGLFAIVMFVVGLAQVLGDAGIGSSIVRSQQNSSIVLNSSFWVITLLGATQALLVLLATPFVGWFYQKPEVEPFLHMAAMGLLVGSLGTVPMALLQQRLAYTDIAVSQVIGGLAAAASAICIVYAGFGAWGLVFQPIVGNMATLAMMCWFSKWLPRFEFKFSEVRELVSTGVHLLVSGLFHYIRFNVDTLMIGKYLAANDLGVYNMAQTVLFSPQHLITSTIARVIFPLLAKVQKEPALVKNAL